MLKLAKTLTITGLLMISALANADDTLNGNLASPQQGASVAQNNDDASDPLSQTLEEPTRATTGAAPAQAPNQAPNQKPSNSH
jgi:hypothetical protein